MFCLDIIPVLAENYNSYKSEPWRIQRTELHENWKYLKGTGHIIFHYEVLDQDIS